MRGSLRAAIVIVGALLALNVAYCRHGSLEEFPTDEQQEKIALVTTWLGTALAVVEVVLVAALVRRSGAR